MKYVCVHSVPINNNENRHFIISTNDKLDYVVSTINSCGIKVDIISPSYTTNKSGFYKSRNDKFLDNNHVVSGPTFGVRSNCGRILQRIVALCWLSWYLIKKCHKNEVVFVYHGLSTALPMLIAKKLKKIYIVSEVEELFYQLSNKKKSWRIKLEKRIIEKSDAYVFSSDELNKACNIDNKKNIIINGNYSVATKLSDEKYDSRHFVYAGLIENGKVAFKCVQIALYLPFGYEIHIVGYGNKKDIDLLKREIDRINKFGKCQVFYDGLKRGNDYISYLQKFRYGLCPLTTELSYQTACFPSKISSYMANGVNVITTLNPVVKNSAYGSFVHFVKDDDPKNFAEAMLNLKEEKDTRLLVKELDIACKNNMKVFLEGITNR